MKHILIILILLLTACAVDTEPVAVTRVTATNVPATVTPALLTGTEWILTELNSRSPLANSQITLAFTGSQAGGFAGCNNYGGSFDAPGDGTFAISEIAGTAQGCLEPEGILEQEAAFLQALAAVTSYRLQADRLEMANAAGQTTLAFMRQAHFDMNPADLIGTAWQLQSWGNRERLPGTEITLVFDNAETMSGFAGCRHYNGRYLAQNDIITFPQLSMVEESCPQGEAALIQEGDFTTALSQTTRYRLGEGELELFTAPGEVLLFVPITPNEPPSAIATAVTSTPLPIAATTMPTATATPLPPEKATPASSDVVVVFVKNGDIQRWDAASEQTTTLFSAGDAVAVTMSDDGQVIAFTRRSVVQQAEDTWFEQSALWVLDQNGENPRELISAETLRQQLDTQEMHSTNIAQMAWIPQTHNLVYSGIKYVVQAEGESHALPEGIYIVNTDTGLAQVLASAGANLRFVPSPDGHQIALMSTTGLSFVNADGSNWRQDVLTYPEAGVPIPILPYGVWAQDATAFVIVAPIASESPMVLNFTIWRVPLAGSSAEPLVTVTDDSHPASVTFSPDGQQAAFYRWPDPAWLITPLANGAGPLAIPHSIELGYANLHWSPAGTAFAFPDTFVGTLSRLCPDASQNTEVCGAPVTLSQVPVASIQWLDDTHFLFMVRDPDALFLGDLDGVTRPIVTWLPEESAGLRSFTAALLVLN